MRAKRGTQIHHPIVWCDIRASNVKRAQKFYGKLFGWKFEKFPEMDYWRIDLGVKIATGRTLVPGQGVFADCHDTANNVFALWETKLK